MCHCWHVYVCIYTYAYQVPLFSLPKYRTHLCLSASCSLEQTVLVTWEWRSPLCESGEILAVRFTATHILFLRTWDLAVSTAPEDWGECRAFRPGHWFCSPHILLVMNLVPRIERRSWRVHWIPGGLLAALSSGLLPELLDLFVVHAKDAPGIETF